VFILAQVRELWEAMLESIGVCREQSGAEQA